MPRVISLAFWGGLWGIVFVLAERYIARSPGGYWVGAIIFGAIFPDVVSWFIVAPLKGLPVGYGFHFPGLLVGPIVNGLWGLGTGLPLRKRSSLDSPLERNGFELLVSFGEWRCPSSPSDRLFKPSLTPESAGSFAGGTDGSNPPSSTGESSSQALHDPGKLAPSA